MTSPTERRERLKVVYDEAMGCLRCPLHETRTTVVFGAGNANAELMFIGEAPGANEDKQGLPFVGQAGKLLDRLLGEIGFERRDVFVANVLKCLRSDALVQLGDGSWERIGRLVRSRYAGEVMSVDADGELVPRRVVGWHATPLGGRRVYRLTYASAKAAGSERVAVQLTGDHPVLTERGYVPVQDLLSSDRVATGQGLSNVAYDVACATMLGDGSFNRSSSNLSFGHSQRQRDYALFKADLLAELEPRVSELTVAAVSGGPPGYPVIEVRTLAHRALRVLGADFYRAQGPQKVVPVWIADQLNARMLAFWFMDAGYTRIREARRPRAEIATEGFSGEDLQVLMRGLRRLGVTAKALRGRVYLDALATARLSELIAPYVPPSMRYKLGPGVADRIPFDPERLRSGPPVVMFDGVEVEDVTARPRHNTTFFCIDVEGTHNFVTAGGVVHNCRPPGNRDPLPAEIESCQEYLWRQVELIEPTVICTLGNFSTKLLRADPTGISRLHGTPEVRLVGARAVRLYPLFHPAAALYTPRMLETLRADFQRLPEVLALGPPQQPDPVEPIARAAEVDLLEPVAEQGLAPTEPAPAAQLGLF